MNMMKQCPILFSEGPWKLFLVYVVVMLKLVKVMRLEVIIFNQKLKQKLLANVYGKGKHINSIHIQGGE